MCLIGYIRIMLSMISVQLSNKRVGSARQFNAETVIFVSGGAAPLFTSNEFQGGSLLHLGPHTA